MDEPLDTFDRRILALVQRDSRLPAEQIAAELGLSASAVQRRLKRLRADKVITAEVALVDPKAVGRPMTFIAGLELRDNYESLARFKQWAKAQAEIQQVYYVTGNVDLMVIVTAPDVAAYDAISARLMAHNPQVLRISTNVVIDAVKVGLQVPV